MSIVWGMDSAGFGSDETIESISEVCVVCEKIFYDYDPGYCCSGAECCCGGLPQEPPLCSKECTDKILGPE